MVKAFCEMLIYWAICCDDKLATFQYHIELCLSMEARGKTNPIGNQEKPMLAYDQSNHPERNSHQGKPTGDHDITPEAGWFPLFYPAQLRVTVSNEQYL